MVDTPSSDDPVVYIVDDDEAVREATQDLLSSVGLRVECFATAQEFLRSSRPDAPACLHPRCAHAGTRAGSISSKSSPRRGTSIPIIFVTGHGDVPMTVQAMKAGAIEFFTKPFR